MASIISIIATLLVLETLARRFIPYNKPHSRYSPFFIYENIPNTSWTNGDKEYRAEVTYNSVGLRDKEYSQQKQTGVFRIAVIGDSFVAGEQVNLESTFSKKLETLLNKNSQVHYEVINFGVNGYNADSELVLLKEKVKKYSPDLVILTFFFNDLDGLLNSPLITIEDEQINYIYKEQFKNESFLIKLGRQVVSNSRLWDYLINKKLARVPNLAITFYHLKAKLLGGETIGDVQNQRSINRWIGYRYYSPTCIRTFLKNTPRDIAELWQEERVVLKEMKNIIGDWNGKLIMVISAAPIQFRKEQKDEALKFYGINEKDFNPVKPNTTLTAILQELDIPVLDLYEVMKKKESNGQMMHFNQDVHWNKEGHIVVAESLYNFLFKLQLVKQIKDDSCVKH